MAAEDTQELRRIRRLANEALVDVFRALGGSRWKNKSGWMTPGTDVKQWHGITVSGGKLVSLNLMSNDLEGSIPSTISNLVTLNQLNMSYNLGVTGILPLEVGNMASLSVLHLYNAGIQGPIPESLSLLQRLEELWLNRNRLSGVIPEGLGRLPRLRELYLNANELVGCIPSSFGELGSLEGLDLSWNQLSGDIAPCLGNMTSLRLLMLEGNERLEETPPAEQGPELLQWLANKRAAFSDLGDEEFGCNDDRLRGTKSSANPPNRPFGPTASTVHTDFAEDRRRVARKSALRSPSLQRPVQFRGRVSSGMIFLDAVRSQNMPHAFQDVIRDEAGLQPRCSLKAFRAFATAQLAEENIDFLVEVENIKVVDEDCFQEAAAAVCSRFIAPGAPIEVNLSDGVRKSTMTNVRSLQDQLPHGKADRTIFDQAQREIYHLTETDTFPRFLQFVSFGAQGSISEASV